MKATSCLPDMSSILNVPIAQTSCLNLIFELGINYSLLFFKGVFMLKIKNYFIFIIVALIVHPFISVAQNNINPEQNQIIIKQNIQSPVNGNGEPLLPVLTITPREINIGIITDDKSGEGIFTLKNMSSGVIDWWTDGPEGWEKSEKQKLSSVVKNNTDSLRIEIRLLTVKSLLSDSSSKIALHNVEMKLETGSGKLICHKEFPAGTHKEAIKINSASGQKIIFVTFIIVSTQKLPMINLNPLRLDMGSILPERTISKKIMVTNSGKEMLTWSVAVQKHKSNETPANLKKGRYISFVNEETRESGVYALPRHLKENMELTGRWTESNGYPSGAEGENFIKINFSGTGIILYLLTCPDEINLTLYLDKTLIDDHKLFANIKEKKGELLVAEGLTDGPHVLTVISKDSRLVFEGVKILGENIFHLPAGSINIMPNSGATTSQTNYLRVTLNTGQMTPGYYADDIVFDTNGGEGIVEVFAEVIPDNTLKIIDIYRYYNGTDYLFTATPQLETKRLSQNNYTKEGIAFRLFKPETPGTTCFYRWYNPQNKNHFYHYNLAGGGKNLQGYVFEGSIGNIATSRLTNTRELYRWYNSKTGYYFYSTDLKGGKINKKRYRFDGIAGYVK
jgi:hypothetical protein